MSVSAITGTNAQRAEEYRSRNLGYDFGTFPRTPGHQSADLKPKSDSLAAGMLEPLGPSSVNFGCWDKEMTEMEGVMDEKKKPSSDRARGSRGRSRTGRTSRSRRSRRSRRGSSARRSGRASRARRPRRTRRAA